MKTVWVACLFFLLIACAACETKSSVSKIPQIALIQFFPIDDSMTVRDTCAIIFSIVDGDGDIGNSTVSQIYMKDSRFDSAGFVQTPFPTIEKPPLQKTLKKACRAPVPFSPSRSLHPG